MSLMSHKGEEGKTTIEVEIDVMQQMSLLAGMTLSRLITERYK